MSETPVNSEDQTPQIVEVPGKKHKVERKKIPFEFSEGDKASTFCEIMRHPDAPASFNTQLIKQVKEWGLVDLNVNPPVNDYKEVRKVLWDADAEAQKNSPQFVKAFRENPWNFDWCVEGEYAEEELADHFPMALELKKLLPDNPKFSFRAEPAQSYLQLITREDGRRQVIRMAETSRDVEVVNEDARKAPSIIPPFEAVKLSDGKTALLIQWIEGHMPHTSEEEMLCLTRAEQLLEVPINSYDLWAGNFLISDQVDANTGQHKVFYIDRDIPETIAEKGYSQDISEERRQAFKVGKAKMK